MILRIHTNTHKLIVSISHRRMDIHGRRPEIVKMKLCLNHCLWWNPAGNRQFFSIFERRCDVIFLELLNCSSFRWPNGWVGRMVAVWKRPPPFLAVMCVVSARASQTPGQIFQNRIQWFFSVALSLSLSFSLLVFLFDSDRWMTLTKTKSIRTDRSHGMVKLPA